MWQVAITRPSALLLHAIVLSILDVDLASFQLKCVMRAKVTGKSLLVDSLLESWIQRENKALDRGIHKCLTSFCTTPSQAPQLDLIPEKP